MKRFLTLLMILTALYAAAQEKTEPLRPVAAAYTLEFGGTRINDTYLTPLTYRGWSGAFTYERYQAMKFSPEKWIQNLKLTVGFGSSENPARNANIYMVGFSAKWGMIHKWKIQAVSGLTVGAGGEVEADLGALYLNRNGNNPVAAKAAVTLAPNILALYNLKIGRLPVTLRYQTSMPLIGAFFSQQYGELYYEIYLGDKSNLVCFANPADYFRFCNTLTADLRFGSTFLRIGYRNDLTSTRIHNLTTNISSNSFVIGIAGEWVSLNSRRGLSRESRVISAIY